MTAGIFRDGEEDWEDCVMVVAHLEDGDECVGAYRGRDRHPLEADLNLK